MMMDWQTGLVCVGFVVVSAAILLFISMVVTKEKSYEEAIAEQRQQSGMLLGTQNKSKLKEKKQKKAGKKVKEKQQSVVNDAETAEDSENTEVTSETRNITPPSSSPSAKPHVEFKEPQVVQEPVKEVVKRRSKKDKVRPILASRDMSLEKIVRVDEVPLANHFEQLHPKDDFELMYSHIQKEEAIKQEASAKEKLSKPKQNANKSEAETNETKSNKKVVKQQANEIVPQNPEEKEQPVEVTVVEQVTTAPQTNGFVSTVNTNGSKEKKKKKNEQNTIQQLAGDKQGVNLQILTTLVRKAELSRSEVQILIDMLLNKQHEAPAVIDEWSEGKADPVQKLKKQLAEKEKLLIEEQEALVGAQAKLKEVRAEQVAERSQLQQRLRGLEETLNAKQLELQAANNRAQGLNQNLQTLQNQVNEDAIKNRKLIDDNNALQMHRQQFEIRVKQDDEVKETMQNDLRSLTEEFEGQKSIIVHQQYELSQKDEVIKQLEEQRMDMERHINVHMMQENDNKVEIQQLKTACQQHLEEVRRLELNSNQSAGDLKSQQEEYEKTISQLNQELQRIKEEKQEMETHRENEIVEEKKTQVKIKNLQNELSSNLAVIQRLQTDLEEQKDKNNELRKKNWKVMEALNAAENRNKTATNNLESEISSTKQQEQVLQKKLLQRLFPKLEVNDKLPFEQWVSDMEIAIANYIKELERPKTPEPVDNSEVLKLQKQLQKNKESLDEYDNLLNELQKRTAETETEWRKEIDKKDAEIAAKDEIVRGKDLKVQFVEKELETLKEQVQQTEDGESILEIQGVQFAYECIEKSLPTIINELRLQLSQLGTELEAEKETNQRLTGDNALRLSQSTQNQATIEIERLQEEINRMSEQLSQEQKINDELRTQVEALNQLSAKKLLSSTSSAASSVNEVLIKKIKKKKKPKKNNGNQ